MFRLVKYYLGGGFKYVFMFTPIWGFMIQFDFRIFFRWVETSNELLFMYHLVVLDPGGPKPNKVAGL